MSAKVELGAIDLKIDLFPSTTLHYLYTTIKKGKLSETREEKRNNGTRLFDFNWSLKREIERNLVSIYCCFPASFLICCNYLIDDEWIDSKYTCTIDSTSWKKTYGMKWKFDERTGWIIEEYLWV